MITVAKHAGFCFGVRRATDAVERKLDESAGGKIYTLGKLIHNDGYNASLKERGVGEISPDDIEDVERRVASGERITVVIRAHGEIKENLDRLENLAARYDNFELLDCTCPYVKKVRQIAAENSGEGKFFILLGAADHPLRAGRRGLGHLRDPLYDDCRRQLSDAGGKERRSLLCLCGRL